MRPVIPLFCGKDFGTCRAFKDQQITKASPNKSFPDAPVGHCNLKRYTSDGYIVKKFTYFFIGIILLIVCGGALSGANELHETVSNNIHRVSSLPESGGLIVLGSVLIVGASLLRRRKTERGR